MKYTLFDIMRVIIDTNFENSNCLKVIEVNPMIGRRSDDCKVFTYTMKQNHFLGSYIINFDTFQRWLVKLDIHLNLSDIYHIWNNSSLWSDEQINKVVELLNDRII